MFEKQEDKYKKNVIYGYGDIKKNKFVYIGITIMKLKKRHVGHLGGISPFDMILKKNIHRYIIKIIESCNDIYELIEQEQYGIGFYKTFHNIANDCHNHTNGGSYKTIFSEEFRNKIRIANSLRIVSVETKKKLSIIHKGQKPGCYGKKHTEEYKKNMSIRLLGRRFTLEHRMKIAEASSKYRHTNVTKDKLSKIKINNAKIKYQKLGIPYSDDKNERYKNYIIGDKLNNPEKYKKKSKNYYERNREKIRIKERIRYEKNKEYLKEYSKNRYRSIKCIRKEISRIKYYLKKHGHVEYQLIKIPLAA